MRISTRTSQIVVEREQGRCAICALPIPIGLDGHRHHRRPRGIGGSTDPISDSPANIVRVHPTCHDFVERNRAGSLICGWLVHQGTDPATVPFLYGGVGWVLLTHDGLVVPTQAPDHIVVPLGMLRVDTSP